MIVTTAGRTDQVMIEQAKEIALELQLPFIPRRKKSVNLLKKEYQQDVIVIGKNRYELFLLAAQSPFFFHPNSAVFRIKRLQNNEQDPFIEAANVKKGSSLLDCTFGLGSDSIVASFVAGAEGKVEACEASRMLAFLGQKGLKQWKTDHVATEEAMQRIQVNHRFALTELKDRKDNSVDCIYFDPMFEEEILSSDGLNPLRKLAIYDEFTLEIIEEALRVAKDRVLLKDHFRSKRFEQFGFNAIKRKSSKFHFGVLLKKENLQ
ncbi:class I SAM-dependent methyltransferase [Niallia sp. 03133]|uniref:class I SAM-dependent methyltransferase n=1 Tax=Niallia sp. 03133 TaxID=3458060 RepID=UPI004043E125